MMAAQQDNSAQTAKVLTLVGAGDMILGLVLAALALAGVVPGGYGLAAGGLVIAIAGVGILLWGRNKASQDTTSGGRN